MGDFMPIYPTYHDYTYLCIYCTYIHTILFVTGALIGGFIGGIILTASIFIGIICLVRSRRWAPNMIIDDFAVQRIIIGLALELKRTHILQKWFSSRFIWFIWYMGIINLGDLS